MPFSKEEIAVYALGAVIVILAIWIFALERRLRNFTRGKSGASLEETLTAVQRMLDRLFEYSEQVEKKLDNHESRIKRSVQVVRTVRFNPFDGTGKGGNQSFATAFLDEEGNGVVISTLYSRDNIRVFGKSVNRYASEHELSKEELRAIKEAR